MSDTFAHLLPEFTVGPNRRELVHLVRQIVGDGYDATKAREGYGFHAGNPVLLDDAAFVTLLDFLMDEEVPQ